MKVGIPKGYSNKIKPDFYFSFLRFYRGNPAAKSKVAFLCVTHCIAPVQVPLAPKALDLLLENWEESAQRIQKSEAKLGRMWSLGLVI